MEKIPNQDENQESLRPKSRDIVKIDGRWAQTTGDGAEESVVVFLDDGSFVRINWNDYNLEKRFDFLTVKEIKSHLTPEEIKNIHWGSAEEEKNHPRLKEEVRVFGEYVKK